MIIAVYYIAGGAAFGALLGAAMAHRRGGKVIDMLHYGAVMALAFALIGLFVSLISSRFLVG
jgi:hypothetical protein